MRRTHEAVYEMIEGTVDTGWPDYGCYNLGGHPFTFVSLADP
jgi:hypothetical protein